jgi:drug/metabolite transporter (DMT)-like permease
VSALLALAAGAFAGTVAVFSKLFYEDGGRPFDLVVLRFAGTALLLAVLVAARPRPSPGRGAVGLALGLGAFQVGLTLALLEGFARAPAALVVIVYYVYPLLVTVAGGVLLGEALGRRRLAAVALGLAGVACAVGAPAGVPLAGVGLALGAAACAAAIVVGARVAMSGPLQPVEFLALGFVAPAILAAVGIAGGAGHVPTPAAGAYAAGVVVLGTVVAPLLFYAAVKRIGAGPAALLALVEPLVGVLLGVAVLGETLAMIQVAGGLLICGSVALVVQAGFGEAPCSSTSEASTLTSRP